jgi:hypothetical protein
LGMKLQLHLSLLACGANNSHLSTFKDPAYAGFFCL